MSVDLSFSLSAKEQLCLSLPKHTGCYMAEIAAAIQISGEAGNTLDISAETVALAKRLYELLKRLGWTAETRTVGKARLYRQKTYCVSVRDYTALISKAGVLAAAPSAEQCIAQSVPGWISEPCCVRSYLRAVFLFCGSAVQPKKAYHIELVPRHETLAQGIVRLLAGLDITARITHRKENCVVYIKEADAVSDFWANIGAYDAMLEHEDTRIIKQVRNDVNRAVNCETANVQKTVNAAMHQRECIAYLQDHGLLDKLPEQLRAAAQARIKNPEATIAELAEAMQPPISKSGMNHRLRKLCQLAASEGLGNSPL